MARWPGSAMLREGGNVFDKMDGSASVIVRPLNQRDRGNIMAASVYPLSKLTHERGRHVIDSDSGLEVFEAPNPHALVQAAGYLKFTLARDKQKGVFFRGQTKLYGNLSPSLLRGVPNGPRTLYRLRLLEEFLENVDVAGLALRAVDRSCREAVLQHYGIKTTWIDVVDNIWVALWFACHTAQVVGWPEESLHFERRTPDVRRGEEFAYVLLLQSSITPHPVRPGYYQDNRSETIDLRIAVPSHFVRPHAQHGLLIRRLSNRGNPVSDNRPLHVGTIRVRLASALDWLGTGATLTSHSLFPPAYYDYGYRELLANVATGRKELGAIHRIQA